MGKVITETLDEIQGLKDYSEQLRTYFDSYDKAISDPSVDKFGAGFGGDSRFAVFSASVSFCAYTGRYGSSSCRSFGSFDDKLVRRYFVRVLDEMKRDIFQRMGEAMLEDAQSKEQEARQEIDRLLAMLDELGAESDAESA